VRPGPSAAGRRCSSTSYVRSDPYSRSEEVLYLTGYTDYPELNPATGTIDDEIKFFPNTAILLIKTIVNNVPVLRIKSAFNIEYETDTNKLNISSDLSFEDSTLMFRPYDALSVINNISMGNNTVPIESTLMNASVVEKADILPANHIEKVVNSLVTGTLTSGSMYSEDVMANGRIASKKVDLSQLEFFRRMRSELGDNPGLSFPLKWLFKLDPTFSSSQLHVVNIIGGASGIISSAAQGTLGTDPNNGVFDNNIPLILTSEIGDDIFEATVENRVGVLVRDAVSSLLAKNMLTDVAFSLTNNTLDTSIVMQPYFCLPAVNGVNLISLFEKFKNEFISLISPQLTYQGRLIVNIDVYASITGETKIAVSINGGPSKIYRFPTFADSLYNSLLTKKEQFMDTAMTYKEIIDTTMAAVSVIEDDTNIAQMHYNNY